MVLTDDGKGARGHINLDLLSSTLSRLLLAILQTTPIDSMLHLFGVFHHALIAAPLGDH